MKDPVVFEPVDSPAAVERVAVLAAEIWREHYKGILAPDQIDYMVERFQSAAAIRKQLEEEGYHYWLMVVEGQDGGFYGACPGEGGLFLSKLYVLKAFRGRGLASAVMERCRDWCRREGIRILSSQSIRTTAVPLPYTAIWALKRWGSGDGYRTGLRHGRLCDAAAGFHGGVAVRLYISSRMFR